MHVHCPSCHQGKEFLVPLYVRVTFRISDEGTVEILHIKSLESLEDKLTQQGKEKSYLTCANCGSQADIDFNEYESAAEKKRLKRALEGL